MTPNRKIDTQNVGELIRQLGARRTTRERFSVSLPADELYRALYAAYAAEVGSRGAAMVSDKDTLAHISSAARWLADSEAEPGLMLQGLYGNGKTTLMMAICNLINYLYHSANSNERTSIRIIDAKEVARLGSRDETRSVYRNLCDADLLAIDDVGEEPAEIINYGMVYTPVKDLLLERYRSRKFTIISTNLVNTKEKPQIREHYGDRIVDRIREMMHIIVFVNPSYRKPRGKGGQGKEE